MRLAKLDFEQLTSIDNAQDLGALLLVQLASW